MSEPTKSADGFMLRAGAHSLFSRILLAEPASDLMAELANAETWESMSNLFPPGAAAGFRECIASCDQPSLRKEFHALFSAPRGRYVYPYESCYRVPEPPGPLMGPSAVAVQECYAAAGLAIDPEAGEAPDHIGIELLFGAYLLERAAGSPERRSEIIEQYRAFCAEHILQWLPALAANIERSATSCFYGSAARLAAAFVARDMETA